MELYVISATIGRDVAEMFFAEDATHAQAKAAVILVKRRGPGERIVNERLMLDVPFRDHNDGWSVKA